MSIKANVEEILEDIKKYSPYPEKVKLVAVTKYSSVEDIEKFLETGQNICGENKVQVIKDKIEYFKEKGMFENQLYPDIVSLLEELKVAGIRLVIATSKPEKFAKQIVEYFGIEHYFEVIAGASLDNSRTSKEDVISYAITQLNPHSSSIIMIGDRKHDIQGAHANYLPAIGILYGYGTREELEEAGADFIIDSVSNLKDFLLKK